MKKSFSVILKTIAVLFLTIAGLFAWAALNSLVERLNHGSGLLFADVELFTLLFLIFLATGIFCFYIEKRFTSKKK